MAESFSSGEFERSLDDRGIKPEQTNSYSPKMNSLAERFNLMTLDAVRTLLFESKLHENFSDEALLFFAYVWNCTCHKNLTEMPFELYGGKVPSVKHLKVFGCPVYVGIPKHNHGKLDMRAEKGLLVWYTLRTKGYHVGSPKKTKLSNHQC